LVLELLATQDELLATSLSLPKFVDCATGVAKCSLPKALVPKNSIIFTFLNNFDISNRLPIVFFHLIEAIL
jgi:hypothetical protein